MNVFGNPATATLNMEAVQKIRERLIEDNRWLAEMQANELEQVQRERSEAGDNGNNK